MNLVRKKLADLHPMEKNVRRHTDKQIAEYTRSLDMFQQIRPMVLDEDNVILIGNGMYEAMKRLGWESADCEVREGLTENQKMKLMMADNRIYELGITDMDMFDQIIKELGDDLDVPGWDEDLLQTLQASMPEANEMVENYGIYDPQEVAQVQERQREDHAALQASSASVEPLQRHGEATQPDGRVSDSPEDETATAPEAALQAHFIVCPSCGARIPFNEIGGA